MTVFVYIATSHIIRSDEESKRHILLSTRITIQLGFQKMD